MLHSSKHSRPRLSDTPIALKTKLFPEDELDFVILFLEGVLANNPCHEESLIILGHSYTARGDYENGLKMDKRLLQLRPHDPTAFYNLACSYSLLNQIDLALETLQQALKKGFRNVRHMLNDPDLENIRNDPRFRNLLQRLA